MKKGVTLIELIIAISLASVVLAISSKVILTSIKLYNNEAATNRDMLYLKEAAMYIEGQLQNDTKSVEANGERLVIHKFAEKRGEAIVTIRKEIFLNTFEKLVVVDYEDNKSKGSSNNILAEVKRFICCKEGNLIYISIESENGDKIERCIEINVLG